MTDFPALSVIPVDDTVRAPLLELAVAPDQHRFVGRIVDLLADAESRRDCEPMAVLQEGGPIGFYNLEHNPRVIAGRDFAEPTLGLRGFFIDRRWQGRRLGAPAMQALLADIRTRHPRTRLLALTVNAANPAALALYRQVGFDDTGERYHGGPSGPQLLLIHRFAT